MKRKRIRISWDEMNEHCHTSHVAPHLSRPLWEVNRTTLIVQGQIDLTQKNTKINLQKVSNTHMTILEDLFLYIINSLNHLFILFVIYIIMVYITPIILKLYTQENKFSLFIKLLGHGLPTKLIISLLTWRGIFHKILVNSQTTLFTRQIIWSPTK